MAKDQAPRYLRFVRALALVSATAPLVTAIACNVGATDCFEDGTCPGLRAAPDRPGIDAGIREAPAEPSPGTRAAPEDASADANADASADASTDAIADASVDGGGPSRGTPELPSSWHA